MAKLKKDQRKKGRCDANSGYCPNLAQCGEYTNKAWAAYRVRQGGLDSSDIYAKSDEEAHKRLSVGVKNPCSSCACSFETVSRGIARMEAPADPDKGMMLYGDTGTDGFPGGTAPRQGFVPAG